MIHWSVDPNIFTLGTFSIRWYGLLFASAFLVGFHISKRIFSRDGLGEEYVNQLILYVGFGTIIGARLGHCLFYEPELYLAHPLRILKIWEGGLASHGAAIGILISLFLLTKKRKELGFMELADRVTIPIALSGFFIRTGNLFNSEIVGKPTSVPWAFIFSRVVQLPRHPTQIYEALTYLIIAAFLFMMFQRFNATAKRGFLFGLFMTLVFGARFFLEFLKENQVTFEKGMALNLGQLLSVPAILLGLFLIAYSHLRPHQTSQRHN